MRETPWLQTVLDFSYLRDRLDSNARADFAYDDRFDHYSHETMRDLGTDRPITNVDDEGGITTDANPFDTINEPKLAFGREFCSLHLFVHRHGLTLEQ